MNLFKLNVPLSVSLSALVTLLNSASCLASDSLTYKVLDTAVIDAKLSRFTPKFFTIATSSSGSKVAVGSTGLQTFNIVKDKFVSKSVDEGNVNINGYVRFLSDENFLWTSDGASNSFVRNLETQDPVLVTRTGKYPQFSDDGKTILEGFNEWNETYRVREIHGTEVIHRTGYDQYVDSIGAKVSLLGSKSILKAKADYLHESDESQLKLQVLDLDFEKLQEKTLSLSTVPNSDLCEDANCSVNVSSISINKNKSLAAIGIHYSALNAPLPKTGAVVFVSLDAGSIGKKMGEFECEIPTSGSFTNQDKSFIISCGDKLTHFSVREGYVALAGDTSGNQASGMSVAAVSDNGIFIANVTSKDETSLAVFSTTWNGVKEIGVLGSSSDIASFNLSKEGTNLLTLNNSGFLSAYSIADLKLQKLGSDEVNSVLKAEFLDNDARIVTINKNGELKLIELSK
jgi:hypothetical protein